MPDSRTRALEQRTLALILLERNRLETVVLDDESDLALARELAAAVPLYQRDVVAAERRLELHRRQLAELLPGRRPAAGQEVHR